MVQLARPLFVLALLVSPGAVLAAPGDVPLPPHRPAELDPAPPTPPQPPTPPPAAEAPAPPAPAAAEQASRTCTTRLQEIGYEIKPAAAPTTAQAACRIDEPVTLASVRAGEAPPIKIQGAPVISCRLAEAVGKWTADIAEPVLSRAVGARLVALRDVGGYECRNRNRRPDGKLSAHAQGLAMDIGGFEFANGTVLHVGAPTGVATEAFAALRRAACGWFLTVLGPGSDPDHATHLHLDLLQHGSSDRYRICE